MATIPPATSVLMYRHSITWQSIPLFCAFRKPPPPTLAVRCSRPWQWFLLCMCCSKRISWKKNHVLHAAGAVARRGRREFHCHVTVDVRGLLNWTKVSVPFVFLYKMLTRLTFENVTIKDKCWKSSSRKTPNGASCMRPFAQKSKLCIFFLQSQDFYTAPMWGFGNVLKRHN